MDDIHMASKHMKTSQKTSKKSNYDNNEIIQQVHKTAS